MSGDGLIAEVEGGGVALAQTLAEYDLFERQLDSTSTKDLLFGGSGRQRGGENEVAADEGCSLGRSPGGLNFQLHSALGTQRGLGTHADPTWSGACPP